MAHHESSVKRKIQSTKCLHKKIGIRNLAAHLKALEQKESNIFKMSTWQEIVKLRAEINQAEIKRTTQRINQTRNWFFEKKPAR